MNPRVGAILLVKFSSRTELYSPILASVKVRDTVSCEQRDRPAGRPAGRETTFGLFGAFRAEPSAVADSSGKISIERRVLVASRARLARNDGP